MAHFNLVARARPRPGPPMHAAHAPVAPAPRVTGRTGLASASTWSWLAMARPLASPPTRPLKGPVCTRAFGGVRAVAAARRPISFQNRMPAASTARRPEATRYLALTGLLRRHFSVCCQTWPRTKLGS